MASIFVCIVHRGKILTTIDRKNNKYNLFFIYVQAKNNINKKIPTYVHSLSFYPSFTDIWLGTPNSYLHRPLQVCTHRPFLGVYSFFFTLVRWCSAISLTRA